MMLLSPAKRRKTSATTSVRVDGSNDNSDHVAKPTTPRRASYLSPTKASLARSHPHLTKSNERRSRTEPRGRNLIDDLLKAKTAEDPPRGIDTNPKFPPKKSAPAAARTEPRAPLQSRQPSAPYVAAQDFVQPPVVPKLVSRFEGITPARDLSPPQRNQPNLPPTPVDLGWEDPPERPRGLSSSSPRGSRSSSGRHRQRLRNSQAVPSSPLKPKGPSPAAESLHDQESEADMAEEEVHVEHDLPQEDPTELRHKRDELQRFRERLYALKESATKLEQAVNTNASLDNLLDDEDVFLTLMTRIKSRSSHNASFEQLIATHSEANKYLDLFAPGGLHLAVESSTEEKTVGHPRVVYHLTVSAPPPWPRSLFSSSFDVVTNAETLTVEDILWIGALAGKSQAVGITTELFDWINACLSSDFQDSNVGILLWGLGQYFDKSIQRAKAFWHLRAKYRPGNNSEPNGLADSEAEMPGHAKEPLAQDQVLKLARYLGKTQLTIDLPHEDAAAAAAAKDGVPPKTAQPKLMVTWNIDLSWTGVARNRCDIVPSGIPDSAVLAVKELFARLVAVQGLQRSFDAVYELVSRTNKKGVTSAANMNENDPAVRVRARKRKKRIT